MILFLCFSAALAVAIFAFVYWKTRTGQEGSAPQTGGMSWNDWRVWATAFGPLVMCIALTVVSAFFGYNGECAGPPDISFPCTYPEYINYNLAPDQSWNIFGYFFFCAAGTLWLTLVFGVYLILRWKKRAGAA